MNKAKERREGKGRTSSQIQEFNWRCRQGPSEVNAHMNPVQSLIGMDIIIFYYYYYLIFSGCLLLPRTTKRFTKSLATCRIRRQVEPRYQIAYPFFWSWWTFGQQMKTNRESPRVDRGQFGSEDEFQRERESGRGRDMVFGICPLSVVGFEKLCLIV